MAVCKEKDAKHTPSLEKSNCLSANDQTMTEAIVAARAYQKEQFSKAVSSYKEFEASKKLYMDMYASEKMATQYSFDALYKSFEYINMAVHSIEDEYVHKFGTIQEHGTGGIYQNWGLPDFPGSPKREEERAEKNPSEFSDRFQEIQSRVSNEMQSQFCNQISKDQKAVNNNRSSGNSVDKSYYKHLTGRR